MPQKSRKTISYGLLILLVQILLLAKSVAMQSADEVRLMAETNLRLTGGSTLGDALVTCCSYAVAFTGLSTTKVVCMLLPCALLLFMDLLLIGCSLIFLRTSFLSRAQALPFFFWLSALLFIWDGPRTFSYAMLYSMTCVDTLEVLVFIIVGVLAFFLLMQRAWQQVSPYAFGLILLLSGYLLFCLYPDHGGEALSLLGAIALSWLITRDGQRDRFSVGKKVALLCGLLLLGGASAYWLSQDDQVQIASNRAYVSDECLLLLGAIQGEDARVLILADDTMSQEIRAYSSAVSLLYETSLMTQAEEQVWLTYDASTIKLREWINDPTLYADQLAEFLALSASYHCNYLMLPADAVSSQEAMEILASCGYEMLRQTDHYVLYYTKL